MNCADCDSIFCKQCFKVFHSKGRKKKHIHSLIKEEQPISDGGSADIGYCSLCERRIITAHCDRCNSFSGCDSCYECIHMPECSGSSQITSVDKIRNKTVMGDASKNEYSLACSVCGERAGECSHLCSYASYIALSMRIIYKINVIIIYDFIYIDQMCSQCGDLYCSRTWMGNPGCFIRFHSKGNRVSHMLTGIDVEVIKNRPKTPGERKMAPAKEKQK
jgi:hypothetical protein